MEFETKLVKDMDDQERYAAIVIEGEAEGAIPNGARVRKCNSEPGDSFSDGAMGTVLSSIAVLPELAHLAPGSDYAYFVEWDEIPGVPVGVLSRRIERKQ